MTSDKALLNILKEQLNAYRILLDLLHQERKYLVDLDAAKIEQLSKEKDTIVMRLRLLEEERVRLAGIFAHEKGLAGNMTVDEIGRITGDSSFSEIRSVLIEILQGIEEMNRFNSVLINRSLKYIKITTNFFSSFLPERLTRSSGVLLSKET